MIEHDAQSVLHDAIRVATKGREIADGLDAIVQELKAGHGVSTDALIRLVESQQALIQLVTAHEILVGSLLLDGNNRTEAPAAPDVEPLIERAVERVVARELAARLPAPARPWWRKLLSYLTST